jgi:hypothetical protein
MQQHRVQILAAYLVEVHARPSIKSGIIACTKALGPGEPIQSYFRNSQVTAAKSGRRIAPDQSI